MILPATIAHRRGGKTRLVVLGDDGIEHASFDQLEDLLRSGDLLVVNRSGTLPSSFNGTLSRTGELLELRLAAFQGPSLENPAEWMAVTFGAGDWRVPTENRGTPPPVHEGDTIRIGVSGDEVQLRVLASEGPEHRLLKIAFPPGALPGIAYRHGRPIQYSYLREELKTWDQQTIFSGPSISVEPPSAGLPFGWQLVMRLQDRGIRVATVLHCAGLSSTGDETLDQSFPLPEYSDVPQSTLDAIVETRRNGNRVIALGTTVARALESACERLIETSPHPGPVPAPRRPGLATLRLGPERPVTSVDALITGIHESGTSHFQLLQAFRPAADIGRMLSEADRLDYRNHEYGDLAMIWRSRRAGVEPATFEL